MSLISKDVVEFIRYYEDVVRKFYHEHYFLLIFGILAVCLVVILILFGIAVRRGERELEEEKREREKEIAASKAKTRKTSSSDGASNGRKIKPSKGVKLSTLKKVTLPPHPLVAAEFKGHTGFICDLDFDINGKYLASCSDDRTVRLWFMKSLSEKEHKYTRKNIELDHVRHLRFSPDGTALVGSLSVANTIAVYRIVKQKGSLALNQTDVTFPKLSSEMLALDMASTGRYIMSYTETQFTVWALKGDVLAEVVTNQAPNTCAVVSSCGTFIATAGFTSDVKLWEVVFSKTGEFSEVRRAMELTGHRASVLSISFSNDSKRVATVSKDWTWKLWDVDVRYSLNESPKLLQSVSLPEQEAGVKGVWPLVSLSPDACVLALSVHTSLYLYLTNSGELAESLRDVHRDVISSLAWDPSSRFLASGGGGDRHIRVWHNVPGLQAQVEDIEKRIAKATTNESFKQRLEQQVLEVKQQLKIAGAM